MVHLLKFCARKPVNISLKVQNGKLHIAFRNKQQYVTLILFLRGSSIPSWCDLIPSISFWIKYFFRRSKHLIGMFL